MRNSLKVTQALLCINEYVHFYARTVIYTTCFLCMNTLDYAILVGNVDSVNAYICLQYVQFHS